MLVFLKEKHRHQIVQMAFLLVGAQEACLPDQVKENIAVS